MEEIYLFVKILVFVKILSQGRRKGGQEFRSLEVRGKLIALKKHIYLVSVHTNVDLYHQMIFVLVYVRNILRQNMSYLYK